MSDEFAGQSDVDALNQAIFGATLDAQPDGAGSKPGDEPDPEDSLDSPDGGEVEEEAVEDEVAAEPAEEAPKKSRAQDRIRQLANEKRALEQQLQSQQGNQQLSQLQGQLGQYQQHIQQLAAQNQYLYQQMQAMQQGPQRGQAEPELTDIEREFKKYHDKFSSQREKALVAEIEQMKKKTEQWDRYQAQQRQREMVEGQKSGASKAATQHILSKLDAAQQQELMSVGRDLTLAYTAAYDSSSDEAAQHVANLLERYRKAVNAAEKKKVVEKVQQSKAAPAVTSAAKPTVKNPRVMKNLTPQQLAPYGSGIDALFAAAADGYRRIQR